MLQLVDTLQILVEVGAQFDVGGALVVGRLEKSVNFTLVEVHLAEYLRVALIDVLPANLVALLGDFDAILFLQEVQSSEKIISREWMLTGGVFLSE